MKVYEYVQQSSIHTELVISYLQGRTILNMKRVFKQHIKQYIQCVLIYISHMLRFGGKKIQACIMLMYLFIFLVLKKI